MKNSLNWMQRNTQHNQNLWDAAKAVLKGEGSSTKCYTGNKKVSNQWPNFQFKELEKKYN